MSMTIHPIAMLVAIVLHGSLLGQSRTADDWFNQAAKEYVKQDRLTALRTLDKGLTEHPDDVHMLKLAEEILKNEEQQQQQEQKEQQEQQNKEKENKEKEQKDQSGEKDEEDQGGGQDKDEERKKEESNEKEQRGKEEQDKQEQRKQEQARPMEMTPQDAKRILDALERQEGEVQEKARERLQPVDRTPIEKDW